MWVSGYFFNFVYHLIASHSQGIGCPKQEKVLINEHTTLCCHAVSVHVVCLMSTISIPSHNCLSGLLQEMVQIEQLWLNAAQGCQDTQICKAAIHCRALWPWRSRWWTAWYSHQEEVQGLSQDSASNKTQWLVSTRSRLYGKLVPQWVRKNCGTRAYNVDYLYILVLLSRWGTIVCDTTE